jgi:polyhydroxyalkanoate synthase
VLLELLERAVFRACHHARAPQAFLLGYCQGGTLSAMYAALRPRRLRGLAVFNAPVRFSEAGRFRRWVDPEHFSVEEAIDPERLMPVEAMQVGFKLLDPMGLWAKYQALDAAAGDPRILSQSLSQEKWLEENVPMAGAFAAEFIREAYQNDALLKGEWLIRGQAVDLRQIRCPLFVVAAKKDFICPASAAMPLAQATSSTDVHAEVLDTGHIGIVVGSFGPRVFYPLLDRWFRARLPG